MKNNFAAFILTHGRPNKVYTYDSLLASGYTGEIYIIIDNEDEKADQYKKRYKDKVIMFDKLEISKKFDFADNFDDRRSIVFARNACFEIAKKLNLKYFIQLDDDYTTFLYKFDEKLNFQERRILDIDSIFGSMLSFFEKTNVTALAMAQNGDFIGGAGGSFAKNITLKRKCMNTIICSVDRFFKFHGRINEDVNTYTLEGSKGILFFTFPLVSIIQKSTQSNSGGMTDIYKDNGTYIKSFYSVLFSPSSVKVAEMGSKHKRLHHRIIWNNTVPKILRESHKKQI